MNLLAWQGRCEVVDARPVRGRTPVPLLSHRSRPPDRPVSNDGGELVLAAVRRSVQRGDDRACRGSENREVVRLSLPCGGHALELLPGGTVSVRPRTSEANPVLGVRPLGARDVVLAPVVLLVHPRLRFGATGAGRGGDEVVEGAVRGGTPVLLPWPGGAELDPELGGDVATRLGMPRLGAARRSFGGW